MVKTALQDVESMELSERIETINDIKQILHEISPFKNEPVDCVLWIKNNEVVANDYNPNQVAPPEMQLLEVSILNDHYTQPIVTWMDKTKREVIDGFHRNRIGKESSVIRERIFGYLPIVTVNESQTDKGSRIASTIRHNRARGKHAVSAMSDIVVELKKRNWSEQRISAELGMDEDEILRLCQISGLAEAFENDDFSEAWDAAINNELETTMEFENENTLQSEQDLSYLG
jgi:ParB-like chromosome segregation protein Spo0J